MATAYSGEVSIGTYNRIRIKCDYSGTSATCTVQFRRTQAYSGYWGDSRATLTFNGTTKSTPYSYSGTVGTSWINLASASGYSVSASGGTYNWSFSNPGGGVLGCSGTLTISPSATLPSDLNIDFVSATYDSVTLDTTVGNWGSGSNPQRQAFILEEPYVAGVEKYRSGDIGGDTGVVRLTVGSWSGFDWDVPSFKIYGCHQYHTGLWANTSAGATRLQGPQFYTAPFPLDSLSYVSETHTNNAVTATLSAVTDSVNNDSNNHIGFEYRISEDGGETFGEWIYHTTTVAAGSTASLAIPDLKMGTGYVVEVRQYCVESDLKFYSPSTACNFTTKRYRKTYGPGTSSATTVTVDGAKTTVDDTSDSGLRNVILRGNTSQASVNSSDPKNLMPLSPITGAAVSWAQQCSYEYVWDDEIKQTVLHMWCSASQTYPGLGFSISNYNIAKNKNYAISARYKMTSNRTGVNYGAIDLNGRNSWEPLGSTTNTGIKIINGNHNGTNFYPSNELKASGKWEESTIFVGKDAAEWSSYTPSQIVVCMLSNNSGWQSDLWISDIMIEEITDAQYSANTFTPVFTPYTAKQVAPTPDAPLPVKTVTGRQVVKIKGDNGAEQEYEINLGKNLFNYATDTTGKYIDSSGTIQSNGGFQLSDYIAVEPGECYSYRGAAPATTWGAKFGYFDGSKTWVGSHDIHNGMYSFVVPNGVYYMRLSVTNATIKSFQFEKGAEPSSYSPYFTPIELNKLNIFRDRIYQYGKDWYLHKETGVLSVNPADLSSPGTHSGSFITTNISKSFIAQNSSPIVTTASENFIGATMTQTWNHQVEYGVSQATNGHYIQFTLPNSAGTTLSELQTYFTNHPTKVRYGLTTATDTKITAQPLIDDLNKLKQSGHTYVDSTTFDINGYGNKEATLDVGVTSNAGDLPPYYQRLEYIQSDGNQYIATPVVPTTSYRVELVADWTYGACGGSNYPSEGRTLFDMRHMDQNRMSILAGSTAHEFTGLSTGKHTYYIDYLNSYMGVDDDVYNYNVAQVVSTKPLAIGAWLEGGGYYYKAIGKTYRFTIYDVGTKVYDFVPCKSLKDNKVGMYDTINKKFYPSSSGTDFTAGPAVSGLVTKQIRKLYGPKPAKKNLLDVPLNFTVTSSNHYRSIPVTLEANKTYTMSVQDITSDGATTFLVSTWNGSTEVGSGHSFTATDKTWTFTRTGDCTNIYIYSSYNWADSGNHTTIFHGLMIEEGTSTSEYEAYSDGIGAGNIRRIKKLYGPTPAQVNLIHVGPTNTIESTATSQGITHYRDRLTCEEVTTIGTASTTWSNFGPQYTVSWPAGTYTLSIDHKLPFSVIIQINTGSAANKIIPVGSTSVTFTTTATTNSYYFFIGALTSGKYYNETFKVQLVKGSTPDYDFKLYSDGTNAGKSKLIYNG